MLDGERVSLWNGSPTLNASSVHTEAEHRRKRSRRCQWTCLGQTAGQAGGMMRLGWCVPVGAR